MNRRKLLETLGGSALIGVTPGLAGANAGEADSELRKSEKTPSKRRVETALDNPISNNIFDVLGLPPKKSGEPTQVEIHIDGSRISHSIHIPTHLGNLSVCYKDATLMYAALQLDRQNVSSHIRRKIAGKRGWPSNTNGQIINFKTRDGIYFTRSATRGEAVRATNEIGGDIEHNKVTWRNEISNKTSSGEYTVTNKNEVYTLSHSPIEVKTRKPVGKRQGVSIQASRCSGSIGACALDIVMSTPHCGLAGIGCMTWGPTSLACLLVVIDLCLPNAYIMHVSGNCYDVAKNCDLP
ncbi:hypothetical protein [Natrinema sp. 74]|uniref:hypothetical protein n=1 Tax=Natrinema sp. 74 TaxID=3384159 RepID=UPI0038D374B0